MKRGTMVNRWRQGLAVACAVTALGLSPTTGRAIPADQVPDELEGIGVTEHLGDKLPLDGVFTNEEGRKVKLGEYFTGDKPVILNLGYFRCPMLCGLVANGLTTAMKELEWTAGDEFTVVTLSIDPLETPTLAKLKKQNYLKEYGRSEASAGWHFLTGSETEIARVTDAVGFHFKWNEKRQEYAHSAVIIVCSPTGSVSRYLYGVQFEPRTLRLSLAEASEGKIGTTLDRVLLFCLHYDPAEGSYALAAMNLMRASGVATVLVLGVTLLVFWRREWRKRAMLIEAGSKSL